MSGTRTQVSRFPSTSFPSLSLYTTLLLSCSITRIVKYRLHVLCLVSGSLLLVRSDESVDGENKHFPKLQKVWLCDDRPLTVVLGNTTEPRLRLHPGSGTQDGDQTHTGVFWDPNPGSLWNLMLWRILRTSQDFHRSAIAPSLIKESKMESLTSSRGLSQAMKQAVKGTAAGRYRQDPRQLTPQN
ncbi:uncharacterized protein LOC116573025 isoform X3 [Mustela erminea]|uniref:uncharacterized protein LOC116573025 isoform X3 n=1 Tax=Mustela erminea TaxID=36723 RepID=UPI0013868CDA|nr:uncharacterized protein LOC116573025 isoform X3 [Mustela erminea]